MVFHHRKLLNESAVDPTMAKICEKYCDAENNLDETCPFTCIDLCPPVCKIPLQIPPPPVVVFSSPPETFHRLSLSLTISLAVLSAAFLLFICYTVYRFYSNLSRSRRRRSQQQEDSGPDDILGEDQGPVVDHHIWYIRTTGLQPSVIDAITIIKYKKGDGLIDGTDCSVCLTEFQEDETLRLLPKCNHAFHVTCIDTWLRSHTNCPMCRAGIVNNSAGLPSQEQIVQNSGLGPVEEARLGISGSNREVERELANESPEWRDGIEDDTVSRAQNGLKINEVLNSGEGGLDGIQHLRRSISVDSLSAIVNAFPGQSDRNSDNQLVEMKESTSGVVAKRGGFNHSLLRLIGSPSIQTGSSSMKRSLSCSANALLTRHSSRNRN